MELLRDLILPTIFSFVASAGFAILYNVHGVGILICAGGGALGWFAYLLAGPVLQSPIGQAFVAGIIFSAYAEIMARVRKCPVTGYLLVAFIPLVPGGGIYHTMEHAINGEVDLFLSTFLHTMGIAGALAVGVLLVSSVVRMWTNYSHRQILFKHHKNTLSE